MAVITDLELARTVRERQHWQLTGERSAIYRPPGADREARVRRLADPLARKAWFAALWVDRETVPARTLPTSGAGEAVAWAERMIAAG